MKFRSILCTAALCSTAATLPAQTTAWVMTLGRDTTAVEQYSRSGNTITGDLITRTGATAIQHYVLTLNGDGTPATLNVTYSRPGGPVPANAAKSIVMAFSRDTTVVTIMRDTAIVYRYGATNAWPVIFGLAQSMGLYEPMFAHYRAARADSVPLFVILPVAGRRPPDTAAVRFHGADSARFWLFNYPTDARVDGRGRLLGLSGRQSTQKIEVVHAAPIDVQKVAMAFAAADAAGHGLAPAASAKDSVRAVVAGAHISIDYFRPTARGRNVFSNGVLGDTIWRTGANNATAFKTDRDLVISGHTIPAGSYTLWTHVPRDNSRYELIFNKQTGQWGTDYDPSRDLVRVPVAVSSLVTPMEAFEISIVPSAGGGMIRMSWGSTGLLVPFIVK